MRFSFSVHQTKECQFYSTCSVVLFREVKHSPSCRGGNAFRLTMARSSPKPRSYAKSCNGKYRSVCTASWTWWPSQFRAPPIPRPTRRNPKKPKKLRNYCGCALSKSSMFVYSRTGCSFVRTQVELNQWDVNHAPWVTWRRSGRACIRPR